MITTETPWLKENDHLICFGDSITARQNGYVSMLIEKLKPLNITVTNAGVGGDKTTTALTRLKTDVIDHKPTAVSIFLGTNDAAVGRGKWADEPRVHPQAYATNLRWIIQLCRTAGIQKFSIIPPLHRFEGDAYAEFGDIMRDYCLLARKAAEDSQALFIPADITFADEWSRHQGHTGLLLTEDGVHLTEKGYQILTDSILKAWGIDT